MSTTAAEELSHAHKAELWGRAYELLVKSGVLHCLVDKGLIDPRSEYLRDWEKTNLSQVVSHLIGAMNLLDPTQIKLEKKFFWNMAIVATGQGYTAIRELLKANGGEDVKNPFRVAHIWSPLELPSLTKKTPEKIDEDLQAFCKAFDVDPVQQDGLRLKGGGANADFAIHFTREKKSHLLLILEFSYAMPSRTGDMRQEYAHLEGLIRYLRKRQSKGVYSRVSAEIDAESFALSDDIKNHLIAFSSKDKPLYKLCQASAYVESIVSAKNLLSGTNKKTIARAMSITPDGLESIGCEIGLGTQDSSWRLLQELAGAYRNSLKISDQDDQELTDRIDRVFNSMLNKLPRDLKRALRGFKTPPRPGENYGMVFSESIEGFTNPTDEFTIEQTLDMVEETDTLNQAFGSNAKIELGKVLAEKSTKGRVSLRDAHAAAVVAALRNSKRGEIGLLALVGNPGIGKTTAVKNHLIQSGEGFLFIYVSPRTVINKDVSESLSRSSKGGKSGTLTLTTNAVINSAAKSYFEKRIQPCLSGDDQSRKRNIDSGVIFDGVENLTLPKLGSCLYLTPEQEEELDRYVSTEKTWKLNQSEHDDYVFDRLSPGVIKTVSLSARNLIEQNPQINKVAITVATQGYKKIASGKSTLSSFSNIFHAELRSGYAKQEREEFARRFPNIIVMVDEVAGDGAGPQFVYQMTKWLDDEFITPFENEESPFKVMMIAADASLGNELVFSKYLQALPVSPAKVYISKADEGKPFSLSASKIKLAGPKRNTVFVMANSFPALSLEVSYQINLSRVQIEEKSDGQAESIREAIRRVAGESPIIHAVRGIQTALSRDARQVIYFAQDKMLLGDLKAQLTSSENGLLGFNDVQIIDNSVPAWKRKKLLDPAVRDKTKVFLMTSSGARGISFPLADWIIAAVPRFSIEASLMEICTQLIYRGRGFYEGPDGVPVSGDTVKRHICLLIDDYIFNEEEDHRQWLRQSTDLMTMLVLLRGAIFTRIKGNAGLRQSFALAPVGMTGVTDQNSLMAESVKAFLREAKIFAARGESRELIGRVEDAARLVKDIFQNAHFQSNVARSKSLVNEVEHQKCSSRLASPFRRLVSKTAGEHLIRDEVYFSGPLIYEEWTEGSKEESFNIIENSEAGRSRAGSLLGMLSAIDECDDYPSLLRNPAKEIYSVLVREKDILDVQHHTRKSIKSTSTWVVIPAGFTQFTNDEETVQGKKFELEDPDSWLAALATSLGAGGGIMPAVAAYKSFPWAAKLGGDDPCGFDQIFDNRYFMLSHELNMLNTLLLEESKIDLD